MYFDAVGRATDPGRPGLPYTHIQHSIHQLMHRKSKTAVKV